MPTFSFNAKNELAARFADKHVAAFVEGISEETEKAIRAVIARSIREGIAPSAAAKMIRSVIGLTTPQALAAASYRDELELQGLSEDRVDSLLDKYVDRKIAERGLTIARTEIMSALNAGAFNAWRQAQRLGYLSASAKKRFITTPDEMHPACPICRPMNKEVQPLNKPFIAPDGRKVMFPPVHPRCRCTVEIVP